MILSRQSANLPAVYVDDLHAHAEALGLGFFAWARALGVSSLDLRAALANGASGPVADALLAWEATLPRAWQLVAGVIVPAEVHQ